MSGEGLDTARVMRIINHPVRMRIIELLATRGPMTWKELSNELGVRTGALYHHLDTLEKIVTRDSERRYLLTKFGQEISSQLNQNPARSVQLIEKAMRRRTPASVLKGIFVPRGLILPLTSSRGRGVASLAGISALLIAVLLVSGNQLLLFSFSPANDLLLSIGSYFGSLAVLTAIAYVSLSFAFKERGGLLTLSTTSALSFAPLVVFGAGLHYLAAGSDAALLSDRTVLTVSFAFFQAWGAGVVGAGMSVASGLRIEKTLVVSLVILYATMLIIVVQGGRLA